MFNTNRPQRIHFRVQQNSPEQNKTDLEQTHSLHSPPNSPAPSILHVSDE